MKTYYYFKQIFDFIFALLLLIITSPLLIGISIVIKYDSEGPILFKQKRIGKGKREFYIFKFRTMRTSTPNDVPTHLLNNVENHITNPGRILRKTSLDELPQLINILRGQMSFIGPRPALYNQFDLINFRENQIITYGIDANSIKPGITGWAQVNGRDELPINIKADYDGFYAQNFGFLLDVRILLSTIRTVLTGKGIKEGSLSEIKSEGDK